MSFTQLVEMLGLPIWTVSWVLIPLFIFCARIIDVSLGTLRVIFIARGHRTLAPVLAFFEIAIWLLAIGQIMKNLQNIACMLAYALGFATGTFVGMLIERRIAIGLRVVRIIATGDAEKLAAQLRQSGHGVTRIKAQGGTGAHVELIFTVVRRNAVDAVLDCIEQVNPKAFYSIEDVRDVNEGVFRMKKRSVFSPQGGFTGLFCK